MHTKMSSPLVVINSSTEYFSITQLTPLRAMFSSGMREASEGVITLDEIRYETFLCLLEV